MVVGLWALLLLPMWLRSHEQIDEGRQIDRFHRAMSQLSQPGVEVVSNTTHKQVQAKRAVLAGAAGPVPLTPAARRRRVLGLLGGLQIIGFIASVLGAGTLPMLVPAVLIVGFLALARAQVRRERALAPASAPAAVQHVPSTFARALAAARAARRPVERSNDAVGQAPAAPIVDATASWQPVRTPAPSYVSAPAATAVPRVIDSDGGWTGSDMVEAARAMAEQPEALVQFAAPVVAPTTVDPDITAEIPVIRHTA